MKYTPDEELDFIRDLLTQAAPDADALLPILSEIQQHLGYVPKEGIRLVARALNLSRADVQGVVTFYRDLHEQPTARHVVQLCMAEACQSVGCRDLAAHAKAHLGVEFSVPTQNGQLQLEPAYCFGNCATGPAIRIDDRIYGRVTAERFDQLIDPLTSSDGVT